MKRLILVVGLLVLGLGAATQARADFAVVKFNSGYCRVWTATPAGPQDGKYLWFKGHWGGHVHWFYRFRTMAGADRGLHWAVSHNRCHHWFW